jgi:hypothetical protein
VNLFGHIAMTQALLPASRPRTRYTIGRDAAIRLRISRFISDRALDRIVRLQLRQFASKGSQPSAVRSA